MRGRGPRGYRRSDEAIHEDVNERLMLHRAIDASGVEVVVAGGGVTLRGSVESLEMKWLAEDLAFDVGGVAEVHNHLRVARRP
jgi:osmotically-inducible protein OsmY